MKVLTILSSAVRVNILKFLVLFSILFGGISGNVFALTTSHTYSGTVCAGGALTMGTVLSGALPGIPAGHQTGGTWKAILPTTLSFSSLIDANAVVTGFVAGANQVQWTHKSGHVYTISFTVTALGTMPSVAIDVNGGSSVILCGTNNVNINASVNNGQPGTFGQSYYYYINGTLVKTNTYPNNTVHVTDTYTDNSYAIKTPPVDNAYVIYTDKSGCQVKSNLVSISDNSVSLQIQNNNSACDAATLGSGKILEVLPNDPNFTYYWRLAPAGFAVGASTFTITTAGTYEVYARKGACTTPTARVVISGTPLIKPTLSGADSICGTSVGTVLLTSGNAAPSTNLYWYKDGTLDAAANNVLTYNAPGAGIYKITRKEIGNELCYVNSDDHLITPISVDQNITFTQNCNTATIDWDFPASGDGTPPYDVTISPSPAIIGIGPFNNLTNASPSTNFTLTATNNFSVASVVDDNGCASDPLNFPAATTLTYYPPISTQPVTGGPICLGSPLTVELGSSEVGVTYSLYEISAPATIIGPPMLGTGGPISFNTFTPLAAGTYKVSGTRAGCATPTVMPGSASVYASPDDVPFVNSGNVCPSSVLLAISPSQSTNVSYRVILNGVPTALSLLGNNGLLDFGAMSTPGVYTIVATNSVALGSCVTTLSGQQTVEALPSTLPAYTLTANKVAPIYYCTGKPSDVDLSINTEPLVRYQLLNGAVPQGPAIVGTGVPIVWPDVLAGTYTVRATTSTGGCPTLMNGTVVVTASNKPTAVVSLAVGSNVSKCADSDSLFQFVVTLTGKPPYKFDIYQNGSYYRTETTSSSPYTVTNVKALSSNANFEVKNLFDEADCDPQDGLGSATFNIISLPVIVTSTNPPGAVTCAGTSITISASGGVTYQWSGGPILGNTANYTVAPLANTTYQVVVTGAAPTLCQSTANVLITVKALPNIVFSPPTPVCQNLAPFGLSATPVGGSYSGLGMVAVGSDQFDPALVNPGNINAVTTSITYTVTNNGCTNSLARNITVNPTPPAKFEDAFTGTYCSNAGRVNFNVTPPPGASYTGVISVVGQPPVSPMPQWWRDNLNGTGWLDVGETLATGPGPRQYEFEYLSIDLSTGCRSTASRIVTVAADFSAGLTITGPVNSCQTDLTEYPLSATAVATLDPAGMTFSGPGVYEKSPDVWVYSPSMAGNGTHTINLHYVQPLSSCFADASTSVTVGTNLQLTGVNPLYCQTESAFDIKGNQSINAPLPGGKVQLYKGTIGANDSTLLGTDGDDADGGPFINFNPAPPTTPGSYFVIYTYTTNAGMVNECVNTRTFPFQLIGDLHTSFKIDPDQPSFCASETTVDLKPDNTPMLGFFHGEGVSGTNFSPKAALALSGPGLKAITYSINTGGCSEDSTILIDVKELPNLSIDNLNPTYCDFEGNTTIVGNNNSGAAFTNMKFTASDPLLITDNGSSAILKPTNAGYGSYTVTYSATHTISGCADSITRNVDILLTDTIDFGSGNSLLQYWKDEPIDSLTASFVAGGFPGTGSYTASQNVAPDPVWLVDSLDGTASLDPTKALVGTHTVTYKYLNSNGCQATRTRNVEIWPRFNVTGGGNYCKSGTGLKVFLDGSQGPISGNNFSYELLKDGAPMSTPNIIVGTGAPLDFGLQTLQGVYTVQVTYTLTGRKAMMKGSATVSINSPDFTTSKTDVTCKDNLNGTITVTAIAEPGYWGVTTPYQYSNDGGSTWGFSNTFTLGEGTYSIQVKDALAPTACLSVKRDVIINEPTDSLKVTITPSDSVGCNIVPYEGGATLTITGGTPFSSGKPDGYDIKWITSLNDTIASDTKTISGLNVGTYRYDVKDAKGCTFSNSFDVFSRLPLKIVLDSDPAKHIDNSCFGIKQGQFAVKATGGSGVYQFSVDGVNWFPFGGTTPILPTDTVAHTFTNLGGVAGDTSYIGLVRDYKSQRCLATVGPVLITMPTALKFVLVTKTDATCHDVVNGTVTVTAAGGKSGTYEYSKDSWSNSQGSNVFTALTPTLTYTISVRDPLNTSCSIDTVIPIINPPAISAVASLVKPVDCFGNKTGEVTVSAPSGGTGGFSHFWYNVASSTVSVSIADTAKFLYAGTYRDSITDGKGCYFLTNMVDVTEPQVLSATFPTKVDASCTAAANGSATIQIDGGTGPLFTIKWPSGNTGATETGLVAGTYSVNVKDNNGCIINPAVTIGNLPAVGVIEDIAAHKNVTCNGANDGSITVIGSGGSGVYEFSIDGTNWAEESPLLSKKYTFSSLSPTSSPYTINVRDKANSNCEGTPIVVVISEPTKLQLNITHTDATCDGASDGTITAQGIGASGSYEYALDGVFPASATNSWTGIGSAQHSVRVIDATNTNCRVDTIFFVDEPSKVSFTTSIINPTCNGLADGSITVHARNGSLPKNYLYSRDNGSNYQSDSVFTNLNGGVSYYIVVRDANSSVTCATTAQKDSLINPAAISVTESTVPADHINVACFGAATGSFTVNPIPASASLEYSIDNGAHWQTSPIFNGLIAGDYNVSVQKFGAINKCTSYNVFPTPIKIIEPTQGFKILQGIGNDVSCPSGSDGTVAITIGGGRPAAVTDLYDMTWVGPIGSGFTPPSGNVGALATQTGLWKAGNYKATVTDGAGCIDTLSILLQSPAPWSVATAAPIPVSVSGGSDGKFTITSITGSTTPYTLRWYDNLDVLYPAGNDLWSFGGLRAGNNQYVVITGAAPTSCKDTVYFNISEPGPLDVDPPTFANVKCYGDNTGSILINITSGQPNYTFHILGNPVHNAPFVKDSTQASSTMLFENLGAGIYNITVTDDAGQTWSSIPPITITEPQQFQMVVDMANVSNITCHGGNTGAVGVKIISAIPSGTTDSYPLVWTRPNGLFTPGTVGTVSALTALTDSGTYIAHVEQSLTGCTVPDISIKVREADEIVVTTTQNDSVTCFGGNDGLITINVSGRPAGTPYTYSWSSSDPLFVPSNSPTITNLRAGWYRVTVTAPAPNLCPVTPADIWVGERPQLVAITTPKDIVTCAGDNSGALEISVSGGKPNYTLNIGSGAPSSGAFSVTGLSAGNYSYTVTDAANCKLVVPNNVITEPAALVVSNIVHNADCISPTSGALQFEVLGGLNKDGLGFNQYNITLSNSEGSYSGANTVTVPLTAHLATYNSLPMGHYKLVVSDNYADGSANCPKFTYDFVLENIVITGTPSDATCVGVNTGTITGVTITGASALRTYNWSTLTGSGLDNSTLNQAGLSAGMYVLTVTDPDPSRNCTVIDSFKVNSKLLEIEGRVAGLSCYDAQDGVIIIDNVTSSTSPLDLTWTGPSITPLNEKLDSLTNLLSGDYKLDVIDALGCSAIRTFTVERDSAITYSLSTTLDNCSPYARSITMNSLKGGAGVGPIPNYTYNWSGPQSGLPATADLHNLHTGGIYSVTVKDEKLCSVSKSITISGPMKVVQSPSQLTCYGDSIGSIGITLTGGTGAFDYSWSSLVVGFVDPATKDLSNLEAGTYNLNIIDNGETDIITPNRCELDTAFTITAPDSIKILYSKSDLKCAGMNEGAIHLSVSGGTAPYKVIWPSGYGTLFTPDALDQDSLPPGSYLINVVDFKGCSKSISIEILPIAPLDFTLTPSDTDCDGINGTLTVSNETGGVPPYQFSWGGPSISATNPTAAVPTSATNLQGGAYAVTLKDANNCTLTKSDTLTTALVVTYTKQNESCQGEFNGAINLSVIGGSGNYTYSWSGSNGGLVLAGDQTKQDLGGLCAGTYTVVVTDTRPSPSTVVCTTTKVINLSRNHTLTLPKINSKSIYCFGANDGYIAIEVAGGSGNYKYTWSGPVGYIVAPSKDSIYNCKSGSHTIKIEDLTIGCELDSTIVLTGPTAPLLLTVDDSTNVKCVGDASGSIDVLVTGGTPFASSPFYKYNWSGPGSVVQDSPTQTNLLAGDYQVSAEDANGCTTPIRNIKISEPPVKLKVSLDAIVHVSAFGGTNGDIKVKVVGGVGIDSIAWTGVLYDNITPINHPPLFDDLAHQSSLQSGHYNVLVTDDNGCADSIKNIFISQPGGALMLTASATDVARCKGDSSGVVNADVYGGKLPYSIIWKSGPDTIGVNGAGGESSLSIDSLAVGAYTVEVRDDNGNFATQSVNISEPPALLLSASSSPISCYLDATGSIQVILSGGKPNASSQYKLQVSGTTLVPDQLVTAGVVNIPALRAGKYLIKLTDDSKADGVFDQFDCAKSVTVDVLEPKASVVISDNSSVCAGNKGVIKLIASNWSFPTPLTVQLSDGTTYNLTSSHLFIDKYPTSTTTYTITNVSDGVGCNKGVFSGSATITIKANPTANIHNDSTLCLGEVAHVVVDFTGKAPFTYTYYESASATSTTATLPANVYVATINASPTSTSTYTVTSVSDANGCSSVAPSTLLTGSAVISVNPLPTATLQSDTVICEGTNANLRFKVTGGTSLWTVTYSATDTISGTPNTVTVSKSVAATGNLIVPVTPTRTTTYNLLSVKDANGCEQSIGSQKVVVTVNPKPALVGDIVGPLTVCQGARLVTYTIPKVDNALSYVWKVPAGDTIVSGQGTRTIIVNFPINAKDSLISVTASNLCTSNQASRLVTTTDLLTVPNAPTGPTAPLCQGAKGLVFSVPDVFGATGYVWHLPAGFKITPSTSDTSSIISVDLDPAIATMAGFISVSAKNDCGAGASSPKLAVAINPNPSAFAGADQDVCGYTTSLAATLSGGEAGQWVILSGTSTIPLGSFGNPTTSVANLSPGENRFKWTVTTAIGSCKASDEVSIYNDKVATTAASDKGATCDGTAYLTGTALVPSGPDITTGQWSYTAGSANFANGTIPNTTVSGLKPGLNTLVWTITKKGCSSPSSPVSIINNTPNTPVIQGSVIVDRCATDVLLTASPTGGVWSVASGQGAVVGSNTATTITVADLGKGDNIIRYTITNGSCSLYDEVTVRNNILDVNAGNDQTVCDGKANLVGNAIPATAAAGTVGFWTISPSSGQLFSNANSNISTISNLAPDNNTINWNINQRGCIKSDALVVTNNEATKAFVGSPISVCGDTAVLTGNTPLNGSSGMWSHVIGSGDFAVISSPTTKVDNVGMDENTYRWTMTKYACTNSVDLKVINLKIPVNAGSDTAICDKTTLLHASPTANGEWTIVPGFGSGTFDDRNNANTRIGGLGDNENHFIWNVTSKGCLSRDTVVILVNAPSTSKAGSNESTTGTTHSLNAEWPAQGTGTGHWELVEGGATITDPMNAKTTVSNLRKGNNIFRWVVQKEECFSSSDVIITNKETVPVSAGTDTKICDSKITLLGSDPDVGIGEWTVVGKGTIANPYSPITKVTEIGPGINKFIWTVYFTGSTVSDTVMVTNNQTPVPNAGSERFVCADTFKLEGNQAVVDEIKWSVLSGKGDFDDDSDPTTVVRNLGQGVNLFKYMFRIDDCISFDTVRIVNNLPTTADAGLDTVICSDSYELRPNTPTYGTAEWTIIQGDATFNGNNVTKLGANVVNILEYRITNDLCVSTDRINITNSSASKADAGSDRNVCEDTVVLSANVPQYSTKHYWERLSGSGVFRTPNSNVTIVDSLGSGRNRFRWVIENGKCKSVADVEISNNYLQANAGTGRTICIDTLALSANNPSPGTGSWGVKGGAGKAQFDNPNSANTIVRSLDQGTNVITWTILNVGCVSVSEINLVNDSPTKADAGPNQAVCDSFVVLSGNKPSGVGGTASWSPVSGSSDIDNASSPYTRVDGLLFGQNIYRWSIVKNSCVSYDDVEVSFNTVYAAVGDSQTLCSNTAILSAASPLPGTGTWTVFGGTSQATFVNDGDPNTTVINLGRGNNVLRWSVVHKGCISSADVVVTNDLPSDAYAGNTQDICTNTTTLDASDISSGIGTGTWHVVTGKASVTDPNLYNSEVTSLSQGDNVLQWRVVNNLCTLSDEVLIQNNTPSDPYAGDDFETCSNTITLKAAPPAYGTGTWSIESGSGNIASFNSAETEVANLKADVNTFKWELVRGNCRVSDFVTVTNNTPTKANAGPDIHDCKDNAVLDGNIDVEGDGKWTIVTGSATIDIDTDPKTKVTGLGFGDNSLKWTISKGSTCFSSDIVMVFNKVPDQSKAGVDQIVCDNYTTLNANDPTSGKGTWLVMSGLGEFEDRNNYQSKVNNIGFGENVYKWSIQYGTCSTFDLVAVRSNKAYADAGADDVTYTGSYELAANKEDNTPGSWEVLAGQGEFVDANNFNTIVSGLRSGINTFRWIIDVDNCVAFDDVSVNYKVVPDADFIASSNDGCSPLTVKFTNYTVGRDSTFYWDFDDGSSSTLRHPTHTFVDPGVYTVSLTAQGPDGNDAMSTMVITVRPHPVSDFSATPEVVYVPGDQVRFYNFSIDAVEYMWYFGHDNDISTERNPIYEYPETGVYSVALAVKNIYNCTDSISKTDFITALQQGFLIFPNAFVPRGDSNVTGGISTTDKNSIFRPVYDDVDIYELQIFNQWGQMVYSSSNIDEGWNGEYKGEIVPQGVYVWKVTGRFLSGKGFNDVGNVMVVR